MSILFELKNHVGIVTIDRQEVLNALDRQALWELKNVINAAEADKDVRVMIITGAGRAFVAGGDIAEMCDMSTHEAYEFARVGSHVFNRIERARFPVIAAVNGFALGGGCELALSCDIRFCSTKAKFGQPEVTLGITPGFGGTQRLPRIIGMPYAMEMILTGEIIDAAKAKSIGLVNEVFEPEMLMEKVMERAEIIANNAPIAVSKAKSVIRSFHFSNITNDLEAEHNVFSACFRTHDQSMAMEAFLKKETPDKFEGK